MKITENQKRLIKRLSKAGKRQSAIARLLGTTPSAIGYQQERLGLPTRVVMDEKQVVELFEKGWTAARIGRRFGRRATVIDKILRSHHSRNAAARREKAEIAFRAACRRREASVQELALKYGISTWRAGKVAHEIFGPNRFRPGPVKPQNLPISTADSPKPLGEEPDLAIASLTEFFNKFNASRITPKSQDTEVIAHFLKFIPDGTPDYARDHVGHSLARGLDSLRRQVANAWVH